MLKVTKVKEDAKSITLKVEGKVMGRWTRVLIQAITSYSKDSRKTIVLDFSEVTFINSEGARTIQALGNVEVRNGSLFVRNMINEEH